VADTAPAKAPTAAIGYTQAPSYQWYFDQAETTPELQWPQSIAVFDQMRRTDAQVTSVLRAVTLPVRRTPWRIDPNGARPEVVKLVADDLGLPVAGENEVRPPLRSKGRFSWSEHLRLALLMLPFGHAYFEQLYRVDDDGVRAHLGKLEYRPPTTIERIEVASDGGLVYIKQYWTATNTEPKPIPVDRLVAYIHEREGGNWLGSSILRPAYKNWLLKDRLLRVQAQTIERNGMGIPVYKGQDGATGDDLAEGKKVATAWRSGEAAGTALPFGADIELKGVTGTLPDAEPAVRYHDEQLARAVLAHFLNLGTQTGSWALGSTFADFFTLSLQTLAQQIASTTTQHVIEDLVDVNWGPNEPAPRLCFDEIGSRQAATAEALKSLVDAGIIHPDEPLEGATRQFYGLPPADPATATPPPGEPAGETVPPQTQTGEYSVAASAAPPLSDEASWIAAAAGVDTHPGGEELKHYWVYGEGAAKWATWTELFEHLRKYIKREKLLKATVSAWYKLRYGHMPPHHNAVHASGDDDQPDLFSDLADAEADDWELAIDALSAALDELSGAVVAAFNADLHPRNPKGGPGGGRFRSTVDRLKDALTEHRKSGGKSGDPFEGFDREQLRRAAVKQGISLERKESRESIAKKLTDHIGPAKPNPRAEKMADRQSKAGQKAAGVGVRPESPARKTRRKRVEDATNAALDRLAEIEADAHHVWVPAQHNRGFDHVLAQIAQRQGFDAKPQVVTSDELDKAVADGWIETWRGVSDADDDAHTAAKISERLRTGDYEPGMGVYGNGIYVSQERQTAKVFTELRAREGRIGEISRIAIRPDAKVADYDDLLPEYEAYLRALPDGGELPAFSALAENPDPELARSLVMADIGRWAAARGIDAIKVGTNHGDGAELMQDDDFRKPQYVVLNRGILMIQEAK
jgi:hypothetical protein